MKRQMRFVIVTGMSGGGKSIALKMLEDAGYYCVDNLPVSLIDKFVELISMPGQVLERIALGLDVRSDQSFQGVTEALERLHQEGYGFEILFMDASDEVLMKRYKETRRVHPLSPEGRVEDGIRRERTVLNEIRGKADFVIDTSHLLTRELKEELDHIFVENEEYNNLMVTVMSFGFKNGIPQDADLVFDVRFLPNPYYVEGLKRKTGNDEDVQRYVLQGEESGVFLDKLQDLLNFLLPNYVKEGRNRLVVAIGCTGGHHRSVTVANEIYRRFKDQGNYGMKIFHRDIAQ